MTTTIIGLGYETDKKELKTEEEGLEVLRDLKREYIKLKEKFSIKVRTEHSFILSSTKSFLETAVTEGLEMHLVGENDAIKQLLGTDFRLKYDFSESRALFKYWDQGITGTCLSCRNMVYGSRHAGNENSCGFEKKSHKTCGLYSAEIQQANGAPARPLQKLINEINMESLDEPKLKKYSKKKKKKISLLKP